MNPGTNSVESTSITVENNSNIGFYSATGFGDGSTVQNITLETGGTLSWNANNGVNSIDNITMDGGVLKMGGNSQTIGGTLTLTAGSTNYIDLSGLLTIDNIVWGSGAKLYVNGWTGNETTYGSADSQIIFASGSTAWQVADNNLANIIWTSATINGFGPGGPYDGALISGTLGSGGQIYPDAVPEPSTFALVGVVLGVIVFAVRRSRSLPAESPPTAS
jgi:hypothetical protein